MHLKLNTIHMLFGIDIYLAVSGGECHLPDWACVV
jgi:hypothetical protein